MGATRSSCATCDCSCGPGREEFSVEAVVERAYYYRPPRPLQALQRMFEQDEQICVEFEVSGGAAPTMPSAKVTSHRTGYGKRKVMPASWCSCRGSLGQVASDGFMGDADPDIWAWGASEQGRADDADWALDHPGTAVFTATSSSSFAARLVDASGSQEVVLCEGKVSIKEDVLDKVGHRGQVHVQLSAAGRVCGTIALSVHLVPEAEKGNHIVISPADDEVAADKVVPFGSADEPFLLDKQLNARTIFVESAGLGVRIEQMQVSPTVACYQVLYVNDPDCAEALGLRAGDVLYGIDGGTFRTPEAFLQKLKKPPFVLTILRR